MPIQGPQDVTLSVFFPAYYDEKNIDKMVHRAVAVLEEIGLKDYEVIIVEDGSPDRTAEVADALARQYAKVRVIHQSALCHPNSETNWSVWSWPPLCFLARRS